ncbi:MAG: DDE-type integrase/transposase/recombinase [Candidatus Dojkabacteria bacterium]|nr:DDE-type integrase/transposase/recombinase [Candidatus Dojkabacteria bacterium]
MFLKEFRKPRKFNIYWTSGPGNIYQIDLFSLSRIFKYMGFEKKVVKAAKGPWVLNCIDMYSRYLELEYIGESATMENVIEALERIFKKMGKPLTIQADDEFNTVKFRNFCEKNKINAYFYKPHENPKNQIVERANRTIKFLILRYINQYGWPMSGNLQEDAQQVLDSCSWFYNRRWHTRIKAIPFEVFHGMDLNHQKKHEKIYYDILKPGTIVQRKPTIDAPRIGIFDLDPEPFVINKVEGNLQGKYQIKSLVTDKLEKKWYKPYELKPVHPSHFETWFFNPLLIEYLREKYGDKITENFLTSIQK